MSYTLVISQYEKSATINYSLRAYSTQPFSLIRLVDSFKYTEKITNGQWNDQTAGGCANYRDTYNKNPVYQLDVMGPIDTDNQLLVDLKGPKQYNVGFEVVAINLRDSSSPYKFDRVPSGSFRSGFTILKLVNVPAGTYNIIPATFYPNQKGPFFLTVQASCPIKLSKLK
jgi:calpain-7